MPFDVVFAILVTVLTVYLWKLWSRRRALPLPPGPKGYPILGNLFDVAHEYLWLEYAKWGEKYGDIFSFTIFGNTTIVLNSLDAVTELLEKRSANYSDRPRMIMANELMGWEWDFGRMQYTDWWRRHRRMFHQYFQASNMTAYHHIQKKMLHVLLQQLVDSPKEFIPHIRQYVGSIVLQAAYGYEVKAVGDPYLKMVHTAIQPLLLVVHNSGKYLVEFLPFLKHVPAWLPGAGFKRKAKIWASWAYELRDTPFDAVKKSIAEGSASQSFVYDNLERIKGLAGANIEEEEQVVRNCAGLVYLAGSDTTTSLILALVLALANNPEVQKRGQEEIKKVVGSRLPDFSDRGSMPYIEAIILEAMRWFTVTPLAVPHRAIRDDVYKGYRIPAGATVTPNAWAILHDDRRYPYPFKFDPTRFLKDGVINFDEQPNPLLIGGFGYGRRNCPGQYLALNTAWLALASILAVFDISKAVDANGKIIEPMVEATDGLVSHPKPYIVQFCTRFDDFQDVIDARQ